MWCRKGQRERLLGEFVTNCLVLRSCYESNSVRGVDERVLEVLLEHARVPVTEESLLQEPDPRLISTRPSFPPCQSPTRRLHRRAGMIYRRKSGIAENDGGEEGWQSGGGVDRARSAHRVSDSNDQLVPPESKGREGGADGLGKGVEAKESGVDVGHGCECRSKYLVVLRERG